MPTSQLRLCRSVRPLKVFLFVLILFFLTNQPSAQAIGDPEPAAASLELQTQAMSERQPGVQKIDFNRDIRPILSNNCFACHGPDEAERQADLRLDHFEGSTTDLGNGPAITPLHPELSELIARIETHDADLKMPPGDSGKSISPEELQLLKTWITSGAEYAPHWSYTPPQRPDVASTLESLKPQSWVKNPIDVFILQKHNELNLTAKPEADRRILARRASLDLTGLPLSTEELNAFLEDQSEDAYEKLIDRLLAKPTFGEHWAHYWLDLARYADSAGYADDPLRTIWLYRDYVIDALNENMPFDQFTIEQIAGDLLENPTREQLIATAFHRNTMTNSEGGTDDEEFRNVAVVDRVNTTFSVWTGTTMACAQCHTHKFDPITLHDYFQAFAIFNNTADADRNDEAPLYEDWTVQQRARRQELETEIASLKAASSESQTPEQTEKLEALNKELESIKPVTVPIQKELVGDSRRATKIQLRGNFRNTGDIVEPGVPSLFIPDFPSPALGSQFSRMDLAHWLISRENPLTARVQVNRFWEQIFGIGLVSTSEDFGLQGEYPAHPELLDWLAVEYMESGWNTKHLIKLIVTSATYRQASDVSPGEWDADPENRQLARGPRVRLSAEMIRDQSLAVAGLLSPKMYGPPTKPVQPETGLSAAFGSRIDWQTSEGEDRYRRAIYTLLRRSNPYPSLTTFDAPTREVCTTRRIRTNTPLQALVTLNDPVYFEMAQSFSRRVLVNASISDSERLQLAFGLALAREPNEMEQERLLVLLEQARERFAIEPENALKIATEPLGPLPEEAPVSEFASWTMICHVILNLDEFLMKL